MAITKEEIQKATAIDITLVAESLGYKLQEFNKYWQAVDHPSLRFYKNTNTYRWYSQDVGGNAIDLVRNETGKSFPEAVSYLLNSNFKSVDMTRTFSKKKKEPFRYYFKHDKSFKEVRDYLINERKINPQIVDKLHQKGFLRQDFLKQCIFAWSKNSKIVGASVQGTIENYEKYDRGYFKGIAENSESNFGFNISIGTPKKIFIFEAPIDLLSYWSLNPDLKDCMLASMDGAKEQALQNFVDYCISNKGTYPTEGVYICTDNDRVGQQFMQKFEDKSLTFETKMPLFLEFKLYETFEQLTNAWAKKEGSLYKERLDFLKKHQHDLLQHVVAKTQKLESPVLYEQMETFLSSEVENCIDTFVNKEYVDYNPTQKLESVVEKIEIPIFNNIPENWAIPEKYINIYQEAIKELGSSLDWKMVAAIHKYETNLSQTNEIVGLEGKPLYFGKLLAHKEKPSPLTDEQIKEKLQLLVSDFETCKTNKGYSLEQLLSKKVNLQPVIEEMSVKINRFYELYENQGYKPVQAVLKDWNDKLKEVTSKPEKVTYKNYQNEQTVQVEKDYLKNQYHATIKSEESVVGFFEASSPEEMKKILKNYGFQSMDKEDIRKYKPRNKELAPMLERG